MDQRVIRAMRKRLVYRQSGLCHYCNCVMTETDGMTPTSATLDHIVPVFAGGKTVFGNLVACCWACNQEKADSLEFKGKFSPKKRRKHRRAKVAADAGIIADREQRKMAARCQLGRLS